MLIGIVSSFVASVVWAGVALFIAGHTRKARAKPFIGKYKMLHQNMGPTGGTVTIKYNDSWWENLIGSTAVLKVFAEHGSGSAPGTEDWSGVVEVLGVSNIASGFYWYTNGQGGALHFALSRDHKQITEHGMPYDPQHQEFVRLLVRQ